MKLLIVEDDTISRLLLVSTVQSLGYGVTACADAEEAWEYLKQHDVGIVLSDMSLPGMDGVQLCREIRKSNSAYVGFILVTNSTSAALADARLLDAGIDDFVSKPARVDELKFRLRVAERLVQSSRRLQQLENALEPKQCGTERR